MKYYLKSFLPIMLIGMILFGVTSLIAAQKPMDNKAELRQKLSTHKIAFLTDRMQLTESEAEKFWPIYKAYELEKKGLRENKVLETTSSEISEKDAEKALDNMLDIKNKELDIQKKYIGKFKSVLPASKVLKLMKAEREFKSKMVRKVKEKQKHKQRMR